MLVSRSSLWFEGHSGSQQLEDGSESCMMQASAVTTSLSHHEKRRLIKIFAPRLRVLQRGSPSTLQGCCLVEMRAGAASLQAQCRVVFPVLSAKCKSARL